MATNSKTFKTRNGSIELMSSAGTSYKVSVEDDGSLSTERIYSLGDTGPGGGTIFYDAGSVESWGRYLEAAPNTWYGGSSDPKFPWSAPEVRSQFTPILTAIGTGSTNTDNMIAQSNAPGYAAIEARSYNGGGKTDWFLPSLYEMVMLCNRKNIVSPLATGFEEDRYWTSTQSNYFTGERASILQTSYTCADNNITFKSESRRVRPIRAF